MLSCKTELTVEVASTGPNDCALIPHRVSDAIGAKGGAHAHHNHIQQRSQRTRAASQGAVEHCSVGRQRDWDALATDVRGTGGRRDVHHTVHGDAVAVPRSTPRHGGVAVEAGEQEFDLCQGGEQKRAEDDIPPAASQESQLVVVIVSAHQHRCHGRIALQTVGAVRLVHDHVRLLHLVRLHICRLTSDRKHRRSCCNLREVVVE